MDLKSMLNDSTVHRQAPRVHTPQSSFDRGAERAPSYEPPSERQNPHHPLPISSDSRSPQSGGYFPIQSPQQQNSASTPSVGGLPIHAQSPGTHGQTYTPRDGVLPQNAYQPYYAPSPSSHPPTPGSAQYYHNSSQPPAYPQASGPPGHVQRQLTRDEVAYANGNLHIQNRQISPSAQFQPPSATPLGPPATYPRPSPHSQRPVSQGYENYRRSSFGSVGSAHSRDYSVHHMGHPESVQGNIGQRTYSAEEDIQRERERSMESVSPKTIPKPTPQRQTSANYQESRPDMHPQEETRTAQALSAAMHMTPDRHGDGQNLTSTPKSWGASAEPRATSHFSSARPSPAPVPASSMTPQSIHSSLPTQPSPPVTKQPSLKRNASVISATSNTAMPPRKRLRRDDIPIFAQSARRGRPLRFDRRGPMPRPTRADAPIKKESADGRVTNGHPVATPALPAASAPRVKAAPAPEPGWEASILNVAPYEDLTRSVCDWIVGCIGNATLPPGGAMFEIEAKVGAIVEVDEDSRLNLPVTTETIFNKDKWKRTKFESTMNMAQHKQLNAFLNETVQKSFADAQTSPRQVILFDHPKESDEFFNLTPEGRRHLDQSITHWLNPRHTPRVRRTIDLTTGQQKAQIIKSRIADLEVYNPKADFDYRISISIESPWNGEPHHLTEMTEVGRDRNKDRMSYRHLAYQIDLTQVSYANSKQQEHELEVEISTEQIRVELERLRAGEPSHYEELVRGFLDNVRILCRQGTVRPMIRT